MPTIDKSTAGEMTGSAGLLNLCFAGLMLKVLIRTIDALGHFQLNRIIASTVGGDGGCRVGEVRAGTTPPMPDHKGFKLQQLSEIQPLHFEVNFQNFSTLMVNNCCNHVLIILCVPGGGPGRCPHLPRDRTQIPHQQRHPQHAAQRR